LSTMDAEARPLDNAVDQRMLMVTPSAPSVGTAMRMVSARPLFLAVVLLGDPCLAYTQIFWGEMPWERKPRLALEPRVMLPGEGEVVAGDLVISVRVPPEANARRFLAEAAYWDARSKNWIPAGPLGPEFPGSTNASTIVPSDVRATLNSTATRWRIHVRVTSPPGDWGAWCEFAWKAATPPKWPPAAPMKKKGSP